jgi:uncharacterized protein
MSADNPAQPRTRSTRPCPICGKPASARYRPFCSKRCADIDLGRWLGEAYRIPAEEEENGNDSVPEGGSEKGDEE